MEFKWQSIRSSNHQRRVNGVRGVRYHIFLEETSTFYKAVDLSVDVLFWIDLLMTFFVGFKPSRSLITEYDLKHIATRYLRHWFIIDFLAVLPIDRIVNAFVSGASIFKPVLMRF